MGIEMKIVSTTYANRLAIVEEFAHLGARAVVLSNLCHIRPAEAREICRQIQKKQATSGQTPTDHQWFLQTHERRKHGALLLLLFARFAEYHQQQLPNDYIALGALLAYKTYSRLVPDRLVSVERFFLLIDGGFKLSGIFHHGYSGYGTDNIKILKCKNCQIPHLVEDFRISFICPACKTRK